MIGEDGGSFIEAQIRWRRKGKDGDRMVTAVAQGGKAINICWPGATGVIMVGKDET